MKLTKKTLSNETIRTCSVPRKRSVKESLRWNPELTGKQRRSIIKELKELLAGRVLYMRDGERPNGESGTAYVIPNDVYWLGDSLIFRGISVCAGKNEDSLFLVRNVELMRIIPDSMFRTMSHQEFADIIRKKCKQFNPDSKF